MGTPEQAPGHRYQKIVADPAGLDRLLVDVFPWRRIHTRRR
ncbi:MAG: hypothetical protein OXE42_09080 [Gammaproteobacteria bacterium]|nr:hypothetical protein [Gammaproteobacteria bacterium]